MRLTFVLLVLTNFACACFGAKLYLRDVSPVPATSTLHLFRNNILYVYKTAPAVSIECFLPNKESNKELADYKYDWVSSNRDKSGTQPIKFNKDKGILEGLQEDGQESNTTYTCSLSKTIQKDKVVEKYADDVKFVMYKADPSFQLKHGLNEASENKMEDADVTISPDLLGNSPKKYTWLYRKEDDKTKPEEIITENETVSPIFAEKHPDLAKRMKFFPNGDVSNGQLEIKNLKKEDRATYIAQFNVTDDRVERFSTLVRVKGRLDALWPFLGIVAEVIILVAIIFIYERRRAKRDAESDDTPDQKQPLASANNDNVRKR